MILTTPLLARLGTEGEVHVVATPANAGVLANHPAVTSVILYDKRALDRGLGGLRRVAAALRATGATTAYLAQGSWRTSALARLAGIEARIGFATSDGRWFYTQRVPYDRDRHHAQRLWMLASPAGGSDEVPVLRPALYPSAADVARVDELLEAAGVHHSERLVALAPGSVWATKRWPSYAALAADLVAQWSDARVVVLGATGDTALAAAIVAAVTQQGGRPALDTTGQLSLLGSAALLARCAVLVSNDSAPLHLASAMNTPTVALFGPTVPALGFGPLAERRQVIEESPLACRPCHAHGPIRCPLGHWRCMRDIAPSRVAAAVAAVSSETPT